MSTWSSGKWLVTPTSGITGGSPVLLEVPPLCQWRPCLRCLWRPEEKPGPDGPPPCRGPYLCLGHCGRGPAPHGLHLWGGHAGPDQGHCFTAPWYPRQLAPHACRALLARWLRGMVADGARHFLQARQSSMGAETMAIATALVERYEQSTSAQLWHKQNSHFRCSWGLSLESTTPACDFCCPQSWVSV